MVMVRKKEQLSPVCIMTAHIVLRNTPALPRLVPWARLLGLSPALICYRNHVGTAGGAHRQALGLGNGVLGPNQFISSHVPLLFAQLSRYCGRYSGCRTRTTREYT